jgi:hypothetical protein
VQVYTVARKPAESWVGALSNGQVDAIVAQVQRETGLCAEAYYGMSESAAATALTALDRRASLLS